MNGNLLARLSRRLRSGTRSAPLVGDYYVTDHADLLSSLERMLLEFDFMIEAGLIPDVRDDIIFVEARAAVAKAAVREAPQQASCQCWICR